LKRIAGGDALGMVFQPEAARALFMYEWPRNVRELELALAAAAALTDDGKLRREYLPSLVRRSAPARPVAEPAEVEDDLKRRLTDLFQEHQGNVSAVARRLGKARVQVRRWCKRFAIDPESFRV
jgi:transcriptional regulator of acetoin/glycerol metabolism